MKKNILKIASLFIITITLVFGFNLNADAISISGGKGYIWSEITYGSSELILKNEKTGGSEIAQNTYRYKVNDAGYEPYAYCIDAQLVSDVNDLKGRNLFTGDKKQNAYDAGLVAIVTNTIGDPSSNENYLARMLAVRAWTYAFNKHTTSGKYNTALYAGFNLTNKFIDYSNDYTNTAALVNELNTKIGSNAVNKISDAAFGGESNKYYVYEDPVGSQSSIIGTAWTYFVDALKAAINYLDSSVGNLTVSQGADSLGGITENGNNLSREVVHTINLGNVSENSNFIIGSLTGANNPNVTSSITKIAIGGADDYTVGTDVIAAYKAKNGSVPNNLTIKITVHFEGNKDSLDCNNSTVSYSIPYSFSNPGSNINYTGSIVSRNGAQATQSYIVVRPGGDSTGNNGSATIPGVARLIENCISNCEKYLEECNSGNSESCDKFFAEVCPYDCNVLSTGCHNDLNPKKDEFCQKYDEVCSKPSNDDYQCDYYVSNSTCCDKDNNLIIDDDVKVLLIGPGEDNPVDSSIKTCFVDKVNKHPAGVHDQDNNSYTFKSNSYCTVSCKEDYVMNMPGAKRVNADRYFTFKANLNATKACYTNSIDVDKVKEEIIELQYQMMAASNEYQKYKALNSAPMEEIKESYEECTCDADGKVTCDTKTAVIGWEYGGSSNHHAILPTQNILPNNSGLGISVRYDSTGDYTETYVFAETYSSTYSCSDDSQDYTSIRSIDGVSESEVRAKAFGKITASGETFEQRMEKAKATMAALRDALLNIATEIKACVDWTTDINFNPEVTYDYQEADYMQMLKDNSIFDPYMEQASPTQSDVKYWYCNKSSSDGSVSVDDQYTECIGGDQANLDKPTYESARVILCFPEASGPNEEGCSGNSTVSIPLTVYKKAEASKEVDYVPSTLFYNHYTYGDGEIITKNHADAINNKNATPLEHKLPVALGRNRGAYQYSIKIKDIGENYENGSLGRYDNVLGGDSLDYVCTYLVNIQSNNLHCNFDNCNGDCVTECVGPNCEGNLTCDGNNCTTDCLSAGCIYDSAAGSQIYPREVTLNNFFYNGTTAYNWDASEDSVNEKAKKTVAEIQNNGDAVYNGVFDTDQPLLSVTITPSSAREIKNIDEDTGLRCEDFVKNGEIKYRNLFCFSNFIDELLDGSYGDIVNTDRSYIYDGARNSENADNPNVNSYFKIWDGTVSDSLMLGPSWK